MQEFDELDRQDSVLSARVKQSAAHFDARVFSVPDTGVRLISGRKVLVVGGRGAGKDTV